MLSVQVVPMLLGHKRDQVTNPEAVLWKVPVQYDGVQQSVRHTHLGLTVTSLVYVPDLFRHEDEHLMADVGTRIAVVAIGDVTQPALRAVSYAQATMPTELYVVHADVGEEHTAALQHQWEQEMPEVPLEILPNPYRGTVGPVVHHICSLRDRAGPGTIINVILPEFIVPTRLGQLLHNQTGLALKAALLLEPDTAVTSSPWHLLPTAEGYAVRQIGGDE